MNRAILTPALTFLAAPPGIDAQSSTLLIDDLVSLRRVGSSALSPDGSLVACAVRETCSDEDAYETEVWLGDRAGNTRRQISRGKKSKATTTPQEARP